MAPPKKKNKENSKPLENPEEKTDVTMDCVAGPSRMESPRKKNKESSKPLENLEGNTNEILDCVAGPSSKDGSVFLDAGAGPSKEFTSSSVEVTPSLKFTSSPTVRGKRSFKKLSVGCSPILPINDDCSEISEVEKQAPKEESLSKTEEKIVPESEDAENSIVKAMTKEEMQQHVNCCLQLSSENKITTKNAFALKLIDCMSIIAKSSSENNFAAIACQLDAGANIYSHRVDAVHQQVVALAETFIMASKRSRRQNQGDQEGNGSDEDEDIVDPEDGKRKRNRKKNVIAKRSDIKRTFKPADPREKFLRVKALPGEIMNNVRIDSDLSLSLELDAPFWPKPDAKPVRATGTCFIDPSLYRSVTSVIKERSLGPVLDAACSSTMEPHYSPPTSPPNNSYAGGYEDFDNEDLEEEGRGVPEKNANNDLEIINTARARIMNETSMEPSRLEVMNALFHKPNESDYHYLKMDNWQYWAGPEYWKRHVQGAPPTAAANKKAAPRKKKQPAMIKYDSSSEEESSTKNTNSSKATKPQAPETSQKSVSTVLSRKAISGWSKKNVTLPQHIDFDPSEFFQTFNIEVIPEIKPEPHDIMYPQDIEAKLQAIEGTVDSDKEGPDGNENAADNDSEGLEHNDDDFVGAPETDQQQGEVNLPIAQPDVLKVKENVKEEAEGGDVAGPKADSEKDNDCFIFEGDNLVPMVKMVKVEPIKYVAKPNRVNIQHLKDVMYSIIIECCTGQEQIENCEPGSVTFGHLLKRVFQSPDLDYRTREDLSTHMAFLALLMLVTEHSLNLQTPSDGGDKIISIPKDASSPKASSSKTP